MKKKNEGRNRNKSTKLQDLFKIFEKTTKKVVEKAINNKPHFITSNSEFNLFISYPINTGKDFEAENKFMGPNQLVKQFAEEMLSILPNQQDISMKASLDIIIETNAKLLENKKIFELMGQFRYIYPEKLLSCKERICFWANSFNFLVLFTIFYKKWNINGQDDWKHFFQNVKYIIGDKYFTFNDIQYLIYRRPLFFPSSYKNNEDIKKFRTDKTEDSKNVEKRYPLLYNPFMIYIPIKGFLKPIILDETKLEFQLSERIKEYLSNYLLIDNENNITLPELLNNYQPRFICKEYKKFHSLLKEDIFYLIKGKNYKRNSINNFEWMMDIEGLINNYNYV